MDFLKKQEKKTQQREQVLLVENKALEERVRKLEEELQRQTDLNSELLRKMSQMEGQLRQ